MAADDLTSRFMSHVEVTDGCWLWTAAITTRGYGMFSIRRNGRGWMTSAHRWSYEAFAGPIPDGLQLDHLCRNRACVRPDHLEPVTQRENILRGEGIPAVNARKTKCIRGHAFTPANTYFRPRGGRKCRACMRIADRHRRLAGV